MYKILVVDEEEMLTSLLYDHLRDNGYIPYVANSTQEALAQLSAAPDLILLDVKMPGMNGLELCENIREYVACPIFFLTTLATEQDTIDGLMIDGDDYISKPFNLPALTTRLAVYLRRSLRKTIPAKFIFSHELLINLSARTVGYQGEQISFSRREFDIVECLVTNAGQVFDRERLYQTVWGLEAGGDSGVIREHIRKIRRKLKALTGKEFIETVWMVGYRWN